MKLKHMIAYLFLLMSIASNEPLLAAYVVGSDRAAGVDDKHTQEKGEEFSSSRLGKKIIMGLIGIYLVGGLTWLLWPRHEGYDNKSANPEDDSTLGLPKKPAGNAALQNQLKNETPAHTSRMQADEGLALRLQREELLHSGDIERGLSAQLPQSVGQREKDINELSQQKPAGNAALQNQLKNETPAHTSRMQADEGLALRLQREELLHSGDIERGLSAQLPQSVGQREKDINELSQQKPAGNAALQNQLKNETPAHASRMQADEGLALRLQREELLHSRGIERGLSGQLPQSASQKEKDINELSQQFFGSEKEPDQIRKNKLSIGLLYDAVVAFEMLVVLAAANGLREAQKQQQAKQIKTIQELLYNLYQEIVGEENLRKFLVDTITAGRSSKEITEKLMTLDCKVLFSEIMLTDGTYQEKEFNLQLAQIKGIIKYAIARIKEGNSLNFNADGKLYGYTVSSAFDKAFLRQIMCYIQLIYLNSKIIKKELTLDPLPTVDSWQEWMKHFCNALPTPLNSQINSVRDLYVPDKLKMRTTLSLLYSRLTGEKEFAKKSLFEVLFGQEIVFFTSEEMKAFVDKSPFDLVDELRPDKFVVPLDSFFDLDRRLESTSGNVLGRGNGVSGAPLSKQEKDEHMRNARLGKFSQ